MSGLTSMTMTCLECLELFEVSKGRSTHFCAACRADNKRRYDSDRKRQLKEGTWQPTMARFQDEVSLTFEQFADAVIKDDKRLPISQDRQPVGYKTPAGSDDGRSTFFKDLAADLDWMCKQAAKHAWWSENAHWSYDLDNPHAVRKIKGSGRINDTL